MILNNTVSSNEDDGIDVDESDNNTIRNNTTSLNSGIGISMDDWSDNNILNNNYISENKEGIWLGWYSSNNTIINNKIIFNKHSGVYFDDYTSSNLIINNDISFNENDGIVLDTSQYNTIRSNTMASNDDIGIKLDSAPNNIIYHNNLMDNDLNGYDDTGVNNSWDNGPIDGGNYWNDHICDGNPSNGSQPYCIGKYSMDQYPFEDMDGWLTIPRKGDLNRDGILTPADAAIALQLAATGGWDPAADVDGGQPHHIPQRAHDPAGGGWRNHALTRRRPHNRGR
jgi:parallel beta-helix repeat protein